MLTAPSRPLRKDAERNWQRIVDVAHSVMAEQGLDFSMNDVAVAAGVGVGTVYRRFPDRNDLIFAVFEQRVSELVALARRAEANPDPWIGLTSFLEEAVSREVADRGLSEVLDGIPLRTKMEHGDHIRRAGRSMLERAKASGQLRADVEIGDLLVMKRMLVEAARTTIDDGPDVWRRMLNLLIDGLRAPGASPLPGDALALGEGQTQSC